jgi:hypothetical protein
VSQNDRPASQLTAIGMIHTLSRLMQEASALGLPRTDRALRDALRLCAQETALELDLPISTHDVPHGTPSLRRLH